jgi:hypothetical protein
VPCEYTSETRTSHGPSKGYVHHLESKLRELQNASIAQQDVPADRPQLFSAINKPRYLEGTWSTSPSIPAMSQYRAPFGYGIGDQGVSQPLPASPEEPPTQPVSYLPPPIHPTRQVGQTGSNSGWGGSVRAQPLDVASSPDSTARNRTLTPSALRGSMEAPSPLMPSAPPSRPLLFNRTDFRDRNGTFDHSSLHVASSSITKADISTSPPPRSGYFASRRTASFVRQIRSAIDTRFQSLHSPPRHPTSGSPSFGSSKMDSKASLPQPVDYVLPSRKTADNLLRIYWDAVHTLFPFLNQKQFEEAYEGIWSGLPSESDESLMMCTLNVVFALASQYSESLLAKERDTSAGKFFDRAQDLLNLDLWGTGSVQLVQCLLLMAQYLQSVNSLHQCWMVGGLATRVAEGLGLHLPETSANAPSIQQREHLRRLWHGCILLDRYVLAASKLSSFSPLALQNPTDYVSSRKNYCFPLMC